MAKTPDHLHKYKKVNLGQNGKEYLIYRCMKPGCSHYIPVAMSEGKLCECDRCHEPMIITKIVMQGSGGKPMARPHCPNCVKTKKDKNENVDAITAYLSGNKL